MNKREADQMDRIRQRRAAIRNTGLIADLNKSEIAIEEKGNYPLSSRALAKLSRRRLQ